VVRERGLKVGTRQRVEQTVYKLAKSIRERDVITYDHSRRVALYAYRFARHVGWTHRRARDLSLSGLVHDLGKTWLKNNVLQKESPLSGDEREDMKRHCAIGARILQVYAVPETVINGVLYHQEMYNGQGYPNGLVGGSIPLEGRLIAVVDVFDALASPRPYKSPMTIEATRDYIISQSGQYFDPLVVRDFVDFLDRRPDFDILPQAETIVPHETPEEWDEAPRPPRITSASGNNSVHLEQIGAGLLATFASVCDLGPHTDQQNSLAAILALYTAALLSGVRDLGDIASWGSSQPYHTLCTLGFSDGMAPVDSHMRIVLDNLPMRLFEDALEKWAAAMHANLGTRWQQGHPDTRYMLSHAPPLPGLDLLARYHMERGLAPVYCREAPYQSRKVSESQ
jgi:putative two-component system response regulator